MADMTKEDIHVFLERRDSKLVYIELAARLHQIIGQHFKEISLDDFNKELENYQIDFLVNYFGFSQSTLAINIYVTFIAILGDWSLSDWKKVPVEDEVINTFSKIRIRYATARNKFIAHIEDSYWEKHSEEDFSIPIDQIFTDIKEIRNNINKIRATNDLAHVINQKIDENDVIKGLKKIINIIKPNRM